MRARRRLDGVPSTSTPSTRRLDGVVMTIREASRESRGRVSRRGPNGPKIDQETTHVIVRWTRRAFDGDAPRRWTGVMFNAYYNFLLEFSYWPIFSQQVYSFIVGMYFLDIFIAMGLESMLCESLLIAPIDVCINVIENTMTMVLTQRQKST